ncbi:hypothetical protein [Mesorhizobium sp.]|uniref:hypothetical protein n=1 Tax=Mesorhizobium sp. TaxID=1871066 RepID=UPI000FEA90C7|nr:hypothetical protein [Mesorhizobium sp.]RWK58728.1 MAG: hypothetical protein EOR49_29795 [Mesorhizobium sp.]RWM43148.1 MAG: hypothetical protein EOR76_30730 [Mesorhizobium sp.]RWM46414.1 MAG: hypothetical protein EOR78_32485 [Mesorhizobium sp.]RWM48767.1 MAG: hypothetical protein EOR79_32065 [Mesorhizobium sp.]RWM89942.1 MAG: hypothetical protein EOR85_31850 [Mesorhizobium sp.]
MADRAPASEVQHQDVQLGEALELTFPASDLIAVFVPERPRNIHQSDNLPEAGQQRDHVNTG